MAAPKVSVSFNAADRISKPVKGMKKSVTGFSRHTQKSIGGISKSFSRMRGLIVGAGAAIVGGKIARGIGQFTEQAASIERTSRRLGIAAESFQKLSYAAKQYGVEQEALRDGLKELSLRADEFAVTGAGPAAEAMGRLGLSQADINARKGDTQALFELVNRELQKVQDTASRQRIADEIFGGTGAEQMVEMASASSEELARLTKEAEELGLISGEAGRSSERLIQAMDRLRQVGRGAMSKAIVPLSEQLIPLIERSGHWISQNKELISLKVGDVFQGIKKGAQVLARAWNSGLIPAILAGVAVFKTLTGAIALYRTVTTVATAAQWALNAAMTANPIGLIIAGVSTLVGLFVVLWKRSEKFRNTLKNIWENIKAIATAGPRFLSKLFGGGEGAGVGIGGGGSPEPTPMGASASVSRQETENRSSVDINVRDDNNRTDVRQRGQAPGVSVNMGMNSTL